MHAVLLVPLPSHFLGAIFFCFAPSKSLCGSSKLTLAGMYTIANRHSLYFYCQTSRNCPTRDSNNKGATTLPHKHRKITMLPLVKITSGFAAVSGNIGTPRAISLAVGESGGIASMMTTTGTAAAGTSLLSSTTPHFLHSIRGGAAAALVDLSRENLHIQGIATYGVITALIMNAALRM